jgi:citronellyl-CoA synthetase
MSRRPLRSIERDLAYLQRNRERNILHDLDAEVSAASLIDRQAAVRPHRTAILTAEETIDWAGFKALSDRVANLLLDQGLQKGEAVALNMENGILFLACVMGITRAGGIAGLINTNLRGAQLVHCVRAIDARLSLVGGDALAAIAECKDDYLALAGDSSQVIHFAREGSAPHGLGNETWYTDGEALLAKASDQTPVLSDPVRARDKAFYIFTSGTTGLPKPANISHQKFLYGASSMAIFGFRARPNDRLYNCLPLYHGTGLMSGAAACFHSGASMFVRRRFSASALIAEANKHGCNMLVYIGEICRYLMATPQQPDDSRCTLTRAVGNGLRPDVWRGFRRRFGLRRITEFYGASEANGGFMNLFNRDGSIGITAADVRLVRFSTDDATLMRGANGFAEPVAEGEGGLMIINCSGKERFEGYRDPAQSETKLLRNVFCEGDCWFNSGDVLRTLDVGEVYGFTHYQFVDRLGDTFRWKGENVSTNEVGELFCAFPGIEIACVYGVAVPAAEGKAGMAALVPSGGATAINLDDFAAFCEANLPRYARPLFLRISSDGLELTGTHKLVRTRLVEQGYDPERTADPIYAWDMAAGRYVAMDRTRYDEIIAGRSGY